VDLAQATLETVTDSEFLKKLPVLGVLAHTWGAAKTVRDRFYLKKVLRFFANVSALPAEEHEAFIQEMRADSRDASRVVESFLVWLDRLDQEKKAELPVCGFGLYARG